MEKAYKPEFHYVYPDNEVCKQVYKIIVKTYGRFLEKDLITAHNLMTKLCDETNFFNTVNSKWDFNAHTVEEYTKFVASELRQQIVPKINGSDISRVLEFDVDDDACIVGYLGKENGMECYLYFTLKEI